MRFIPLFILILITTRALSSEKSDSTKIPFKFSGELTINSNGIAPVPAFSFGKPTIIGSFALKKNRFSYSPFLSYGLNFKPWIIDNWFHYRLVKNPKLELRVGVDISMFFSEYETPDESILRGQRFLAFELAGKYKLTPKSSISLMLWDDNGLDPGSISGYFINLVVDRTDIRIGKHVLMDADLQTFYIDFTDENDGFFISPKISLSLEKVPVSIFSQGIFPLISNISPYPDIQMNVGVGYSF